MAEKSKITSDISGDLAKSINKISPDKIFVLVDENTEKLCLPRIANLPELAGFQTITIPSGDENKNLETLANVWKKLCQGGASRKSLLVNLGGGMVSDLGGFAASTFKRGMRYLNIPTTLLSAVDAASGGKTGINFLGLKNEIGVINPAENVLVDVEFFKTLDEENLKSGFAEMLKHALISNEKNWNEILKFDLQTLDFQELKTVLATSLSVKEEIVEKDPTEKNIRKALNFGHTIGHAFESLSHEQKRPALHGFAVAWGMLCEIYLSFMKLNFPKEILLNYLELLKENYGFYSLSCKDYERMFEFMLHDKKNEASFLNFTLLSGIGEVEINQNLTKEEIFEALDFYREVAP